MATEMILRINRSSTDKAYADQLSGEDYYTSFESGDKFIFSEGSAVVADGEAIPDEVELNRAAIDLSGIVTSYEVPHYFLADSSANLLREIALAGSEDNQWVFACSFDGDTASEPQLEAWDDSDLDSFITQALGLGTPANSWYSAICTTTSTPGASWTGTKLAGSGASNVVLLNDGSGALSVATDLYFNLKIVIPSGITTPSIQTPVLCVTYTTT